MSGGYEICLNPEIFNIKVIRKWCEENIGQGNYNLSRNYYLYILILDEEDAMAFKLRWL